MAEILYKDILYIRPVMKLGKGKTMEMASLILWNSPKCSKTRIQWGKSGSQRVLCFFSFFSFWFICALSTVANQLGGLSPRFIFVSPFSFPVFVIFVLYVVVIISLDKKTTPKYSKLSQTLHNSPKQPKTLENSPKRSEIFIKRSLDGPKLSQTIQNLPNALKPFQTHKEAHKCSKTLPKNYEKLRNHPKPNIAKLSQTSKHFQMLQNSLKRSGNLTKAPKTSKCFGEFQSIWESFGAFRLMWK